MRVDSQQYDGMSDESMDDLPTNSSESNDHFTGDNINDDEQTNLPPAKRISKSKTSLENVAPSANINMSLLSLI